MGASIGTVTALLEANTRSFDTSLEASSNQLKAVAYAAEAAAGKVSASGEQMSRAAQLQAREVEKMRAAWQRELLQQERAAAVQAQTARGMEMAALKADILTRSIETQTKAQERLNTMREIGKTTLEGLGTVGITVGAAAAIEGFRELLKSTMETGVQFQKLHQQTGISVEDLSTLKFAAAQSGVEFESLTRGFKKLAVTVFDAENGSKKAAAGFSLLGISTSDLRAKGDDMYGVLQLVADKFKDMPDGIVKSDTAAKIFGARMGSELIPVLNQGATAIERYKRDAPIFSDEDIENAERLHRSINNLDAAWKRMALSAFGTSVPMASYFNNFAEGLDVVAEKAKAAWGWLEKVKLWEQAGVKFAAGLLVPGAGPGVFIPPTMPGSALKPKSASAIFKPMPPPDDSGKSPKEKGGPEMITVPLAQTQAEFAAAQAAASIKAFLAQMLKNAQDAAEEKTPPWGGGPSLAGFAPKRPAVMFTPGQDLKEQITPAVSSLHLFADNLREVAQEFTNLGDKLASVTIRSLDTFNETLMREISTPGSMRRGAHAWRNMGSSIAQSAGSAALQFGEGSIMKMLLGPGKTPLGASKENAMWVRSAEALGATSGSTGGLLNGLLGKLFTHKGSSSGGGSILGDIAGAALNFIPGFAEGGTIPTNMPVMVGENGPEILAGAGGRRVIPNNKIGGVGDVHVYNDNRGATDPAATDAAVRRGIAALIPHIPAISRAGIVDYNRRTSSRGKV